MLRLFPMFFTIIATVLAGIAIIPILLVPSWSERAALFIPVAAACAVILSLPITWAVTRQILALTRKN